MKEVLNKEGINPAIVSFNKVRANSNNYKDSVKYLNSLSIYSFWFDLDIPSLVQEDKYDFSSVDSLWNKLSSERPKIEKASATPEPEHTKEEEQAPKI